MKRAATVIELAQRGFVSPPAFLHRSQLFEVKMGSHAFGTAGSDSDVDVYGFFVPPPEVAQICGPVDEFRAVNLVVDGTDYDIVLYSIERFFERCLAGKSQSLETLFAGEENIISTSESGKLVRENRRLFLSKETAREFRRFAHAQLEGLVARSFTDGKRKLYIERFGYDVKAAYHVVRLMNEARQLLVEGDLDLKRNAETLLQIRVGGWSEKDVVAAFGRLDQELDQLYATTCLPDQVDRAAIADLLQRCR